MQLLTKTKDRTSYFLGTFTELWEVIISSVMSVHPRGITRLPLDEFPWNLTPEYFPRSVEEIQVSLKSDSNNGYLTYRPIYIYDRIHSVFLEWEMFQTKAVDKIKTNISCSVTFFWKSCHLWDSVEKYCRTRPQIKICCMHIACWIPESTNTHPEYVLLLFHYNSGCMNVPECCVAYAIPLLLFIDYKQEKIDI